MKSGKSTRKHALKRLSNEFRNEAHAEPENRLPVALELITYNQSKYERHSLVPVEELLSKCEADSIQWINVDGLADTELIKKIGNHFSLHYLMMEDVLNTEHRPKVDEYDDQLFLTLKMLVRTEGELIDYEHISFVLGKNYLLSFQEKEGGDIFGQVRGRIKGENSVFRQRGSDYLLYRLVDTIVDSYYEVLEKIGYKVEQIEDNISNNPTIKDFEQIQELKKEFIYLRKVVYPLREALNKLIKNEGGFIEERTEKYFSDVYDHVIHLIDSLDTYKDLTSTHQRYLHSIVIHCRYLRNEFREHARVDLELGILWSTGRDAGHLHRHGVLLPLQKVLLVSSGVVQLDLNQFGQCFVHL
jgi:magnesium transporter